MASAVLEMLHTAEQHAEKKRECARLIPEHILSMQEIDRQAEVRGNEIMRDICAEVETNGEKTKQVYSNETARKAELMVRAMTDDQLTELQRKRTALYREQKDNEAEYAYHHDLHRAYVAAMQAMKD